MEIRINRIIFLEALQLTVSISPRSANEQIINNVLLKADDQNGFFLKATNYENTFLGKFEADIKESGKICVSTYKLFNLIKEFAGDFIDIKSTQQNWVFLTCGNSEIKLPGVDPTQYPPIEFKELDNQFSVTAESLRTAIERTYFSIGENESRRNLMGLNLNIVDQNLIKWTGADAFRICQYETKLENSLKTKGNIIIPKKSLLEIRKILEFDNDRVMVSFDENTFQITVNKIMFKTRLIEAEFPNLDRLLVVNNENTVEVKKNELINAVRILNTFTDGDSKSVMKLTVSEGRILVESQKLEFGEGNDEIVCEYSGKEIKIGLNIKFFLDALHAFESSLNESVIIHLTSTEVPVMVRCSEWENYKTVLMPVRIKW